MTVTLCAQTGDFMILSWFSRVPVLRTLMRHSIHQDTVD